MRKNKPQQQGQLRIIGGIWRGRKLNFPDVAGLRPTPDRVRETVFNWLQPVMGNAVCLDLFAGSGALGFEAASRGALSVDMVELDAQAHAELKRNKVLLKAENCHMFNTRAQQFISQASGQYDVIFIDPPYQADLWSEVADLMTQHHLFKPHCLVYLETPAKMDLPALPEDWVLTKDKKAGDVRYCLFEVRQESNGNE